MQEESLYCPFDLSYYYLQIDMCADKYRIKYLENRELNRKVRPQHVNYRTVVKS